MDFSLFVGFAAGATIGAVAMLPLWRSAKQRAEELAGAVEDAEMALDAARDERSDAQQLLADIGRKLALAEQDVAHTKALAEQRIKDWEASQEQAVQAARAAVLKAGSDLSTKLLEDHKREAETARKGAEELAQAKEKTFLEQLDAMKKSIAVLHGQTEDTAKRTHSMWQALSSPGGAGRLSEIGLANLLKNLGLTEGQDYEETLREAMSTQQHAGIGASQAPMTGWVNKQQSTPKGQGQHWQL